MKVYSPVQIEKLLQNSHKYDELLIVQGYLIENKVYYPILFFKEITKKINRKFAITFLKVQYDPICN